MNKGIIARFNAVTGMSLPDDFAETYSGDQLERLSWDDAIRCTAGYSCDDAKIVKLVADEINVQGQIRNIYGEPPYGPDTERRRRTVRAAIRLEERGRTAHAARQVIERFTREPGILTREATDMSTPTIVVIVPLGQVVFTPPAMASLSRNGIDFLALLMRHKTGDWGDVGEEDWESNNWSAQHGERILSSYPMPDGEKIWIITERDRSATTILTPDCY